MAGASLGPRTATSVPVTDAQRRRLATTAKKLGRQALRHLDTLETPDTLLRWYRPLVAQKYDGSARLLNSQPQHSVNIVELVLRMAKENGTWGYTRIQGALYNLGHDVGTDAVDGFLLKHRYVIMDRDPLFCHSFRELLRASGVEPVRLPSRSPNLNSYAERWIGSVRRESLARVIPFGERHLRELIVEFTAHYHGERNHQALANKFIVPANNNAVSSRIARRQRLGRVLNYYHREAAQASIHD